VNLYRYVLNCISLLKDTEGLACMLCFKATELLREIKDGNKLLGCLYRFEEYTTEPRNRKSFGTFPTECKDSDTVITVCSQLP
jgi:hypothetical protein